ncbi:MAG TPA: 2-hydroxyacid dehydrogenase [Bacteroidia bacterium]|nr:2-hydroxyacid dehydrogenase [Bacteroidia bacterium]
MKAIVYSTKPFEKSHLQSANRDHDLIFAEYALNPVTAEKAKGCEAVVLFTSDMADKKTLELLKKDGVKFIATRSAGYDHIDIETAKNLEIKVANVPEYSPYAVAEHAVLLMLALNRNFVKANDLFRKNNFLLDDLIGTELHSNTVGVIGTGKIGETVIKILTGFGCRILAHDILERKELGQKFDFIYCDLDTLLNESDIITLHLPLNEHTKYLINGNKFKKMKRGVRIINTSRGAVINTTDLIHSLENGQVGAAGLDVYENEKPLYFKDFSSAKITDEQFNKLKSFPNVLMTAHQAFLTETALQNISDTTISNLDWFENPETENKNGVV